MTVVGATTVLGVAPSADAMGGVRGSVAVTPPLTLGTVGSRSVTSVSPVTLTTTLNSATAHGTLSAVVTEAARTGTNGWSLTAVASSLTSGGNTIGAANLSVDSRTVVQVNGGGTSTAPAGSSSLGSTATLFSNTGQSAGSLYSGTYTVSDNVVLAVPNGQAVGAYTGTLTLSLI